MVNSSGWLEYFANDANANCYALVIAQEDRLLVPVVCLYEVFKRLYQQFGKEAALQGISRLYRGQVVAISDEIAFMTADQSFEHHLSMTYSVILTTARVHDAMLWTQDTHFAGLEGMKYTLK